MTMQKLSGCSEQYVIRTAETFSVIWSVPTFGDVRQMAQGITGPRIFW